MNPSLLSEPPVLAPGPTALQAVRPRSWVAQPPKLRGWINEWAIRGICNLGALCNRAWPGQAQRQGRFGILMYHRMAEDVPGLERPTLNVPPQRFEAQIRGLLERGYRFLPLRHVVHLAGQKKPIPPRTVVLTFDDGFENIHRQTWPILKRYEIPATVFVATGFLGSDEPFPFDHWGLQHAGIAPPAAYRPMSYEQCRELVECPLVEIAAHTHTHQDFRNRPAEFQKDLLKSIEYLRAEFGLENVSFSFPYGTPRLGFSDPELREAARKTGVSCALTTGPELVSASSDPFTWGRFNVFPWDNASTIAAKLEGWYSWAPKQKRRFFRWMGWAPYEPDPPATSKLDCGDQIADKVAELTRTVARELQHDSISTEVPGAAESSMALTSEGNNALAHPPRPAPEIPDPLMMDNKDFVSIVIPTFNRADWLQGALHSLINLETDETFDYEIVVVDNASEDHTRQTVAEFKRDAPRTVRYYYQENPGDAPTRNEGVRRARGNWLAFFDDDQFAEPCWLRELLNAARRQEASIVGGPVHLDMSDEEAEQLGELCRRALREVRFHDTVHPYTRKQLPGTGNALVARSVFDRIGMFDESMKSGGSDSDFFKRARKQGYQLWYTPHAVIRHRIPDRRLTPEYFRWDAFAGGSGTARFDANDRGRLALLWIGLLRVCHSGVVHLPRLVWAWLCRRHGDVTGHFTNLWRTEAYLRQSAALLAPRLFPQTRFFKNLEFRNARSIGESEDVASASVESRSPSPSPSAGEAV